MSSLSMAEKIPRAEAIQRQFEIVLARAEDENTDLTMIGWESFSALMRAPFRQDRLNLALAIYALDNTHMIVQHFREHLPATMTDDQKRSSLHAQAMHVAGPPAALIDRPGMSSLESGMRSGSLIWHPPIQPGQMPSILSWSADFDFAGNTAADGGCPALQLPPSPADQFPVMAVENVAPPENYLGQFFHLAVEVIFNDPTKQ